MKRVLIYSVGFLLFSNFLYSKVVYNPDENTFWIENGKEFEIVEHGKPEFWAGKAWSGNLEIGVEEDTFKIKSPSNDKNLIGRYFKFNPSYPYLIWEIKKVTYGEGYRGFDMCFPSRVFNFVTHIFPGIFIVNPFLFDKNLAEKTYYCRIYLYNTELDFKYIKMVKKPDYYIEITSPQLKEKEYIGIGDELNFKVILKEPAEDVSLTFYDSYITHEVKINNSSSLQLKPEDDKQNIWTGKIKIEKIDKPLVKKDGKDVEIYEPGTFLIKATVLGGKINVPIWTANYFKIKTKEIQQ
ncbi:MAG: hypothetical protein NC827_08430 [Candidatus Omnitrophica bacterium]|nr:hypothetical protein [Candidatus Omnitrophota bacterium]MCM8803315.1 hypothetical protein [Candidatus Omnitrophota bacterium]